MSLPISFLNTHLWLFRASICTDYNSSAWSYAAMTKTPRLQVSVQIHYSVIVPSLSHDWNVQQILSCKTPPSDSSVFWFLDLPFPELFLLPSYGHLPLLLPAIATSPLSFVFLARFQVSALPLLCAFHALIQGFPGGAWDIDACLTSVLSISKPLVRAWTVAIRKWVL